ncbi:hypothetical protein DAPPUDRAFT_100783 [Daphnia pulex]|uniref:Uncharacterized protein n=1 Tax=Daphnia pulex TaxID=6669 RepID=E9GC52_DAPPU|nr:hypothetical protein DAPPUDRAFT_100783 [Daphnia pulex]|eukprot:EFX82933.1 hypothetical protein DAPPUDRAFT_100783 [Daphnia pulex]
MAKSEFHYCHAERTSMDRRVDRTRSIAVFRLMSDEIQQRHIIHPSNEFLSAILPQMERLSTVRLSTGDKHSSKLPFCPDSNSNYPEFNLRCGSRVPFTRPPPLDMVIEYKLLITWPETAAILLEYRTLLPASEYELQPTVCGTTVMRNINLDQADCLVSATTDYPVASSTATGDVALSSTGIIEFIEFIPPQTTISPATDAVSCCMFRLLVKSELLQIAVQCAHGFVAVSWRKVFRFRSCCPLWFYVAAYLVKDLSAFNWLFVRVGVVLPKLHPYIV